MTNGDPAHRLPRGPRGDRENVHSHTLLLDGVFAEGADGALQFNAAEPPSDEEVARLLATIYRRVRRLLARRGLEMDDAPDVDPLAEESPALAGISSASVQGRLVLGPRAGARVFQLGREPDAPWVTSRGPCQAYLEGFDLHANITVAADDRAGVERLCRYVLRPPVAQERLALTPDGLVLVTLTTRPGDLSRPTAARRRHARHGSRESGARTGRPPAGNHSAPGGAGASPDDPDSPLCAASLRKAGRLIRA